MRKLILSLVFVLATGSTFMNASTNKSFDLEVNGYCWENADLIVRMSDMINTSEGNPLTDVAKHELWLAQYDTCMEKGGGNDAILLN